jgi:outer membrane lipoprotein LolB
MSKNCFFNQRLWCTSLLILSLLAGCSSIEDTPPISNNVTTEAPAAWIEHQNTILTINNWKISGKVGVITPKQSQTGYIDWNQFNNSFDISIRGTLGFGGLDLFGNQSLVTIKVDENNQRTLPTEIALERYLDWEFPINSLKYWIKGIPTPEHPTNNQRFTPEGQLAQFIQQGWNIRLLNYEKHKHPNQQAVSLPHKIIARHNGHKVSLVLSDWDLLQKQNN